MSENPCKDCITLSICLRRYEDSSHTEATISHLIDLTRYCTILERFIFVLKPKGNKMPNIIGLYKTVNIEMIHKFYRTQLRNLYNDRPM